MAIDTIELLLDLRIFTANPEDEDTTSEAYAAAERADPLPLNQARNTPGVPYVNGRMVLNGVEYPYYVDLTSIIQHGTDHQPLSTFAKGHHTGSRHPWSVFYPFGCNCGEPGCAGFMDGIFVKVRGRTVEWRCPKDSGYAGLPKLFYAFDRAAYMEQIGALRTRIQAMQHQVGRPLLIEVAPYRQDYGILLDDITPSG